MSANIVIRQGDSNTTPGSRDDLNLNASVTLLNQDNTGVSSWAWQMVDKPAGSTAALSSSSVASPTFTPDIEGTYLIHLSVNSGAATNQVGAAVKTANLAYRIPAALEDNEFDSVRGWATALNNALTLLDDGYGALKNSGGGNLQAAYEAGANITLVDGDGPIPVSINAKADSNSGTIFTIIDHSDNTLLTVTDSGPPSSPPGPDGTVFVNRLTMPGGGGQVELTLDGQRTGDVIRYNSDASLWTSTSFWNVTSILVGGDTYNANVWDLVRVDGTDDGYGNVGVVLPDAPVSRGQSIKVKNVGAGNTSGNVKITTSGGQSIDGNSFLFLNSFGGTNSYIAVTFTSDGANWMVTDYFVGFPSD